MPKKTKPTKLSLTRDLVWDFYLASGKHKITTVKMMRRKNPSLQLRDCSAIVDMLIKERDN